MNRRRTSSTLEVEAAGCGCTMLILAIVGLAVHLGVIAAIVWVVVEVLQAQGVL